MRKFILIFVFLFATTPIINVDALDTPYIYYGYITDSDGNAIPAGVTVTLTDLENSNFITTTTIDLGGGMTNFYQGDVAGIAGAQDGDTIEVSCSYDGETGSETADIDLATGSRNVDVQLSITNNPPTFSNLNPADGVTTTGLNCSISLTIEDPDGDTFNYSWACSDGSYNMATGNTNGTKYLMLCMEGIHTCGTTYTWWVNASDGCEYTNNSFIFTTRDCISEYSDVHPSNESSNICPCADCNNFTCICIDGTHESGNNVNISFYSNYSGVWTAFQNYTNVSGRYCAFFQVEHDHQYWWYANVSEFGNDSNFNQTEVFTFTTGTYEYCASVHGFSAGEFLLVMILSLFILFFAVGYNSDKPSGGAFLLFSGFILLGMEALLVPYVSATLVIPLVTPFGIFIILLGINKFLHYRKKGRD